MTYITDEQGRVIAAEEGELDASYFTEEGIPKFKLVNGVFTRRTDGEIGRDISGDTGEEDIDAVEYVGIVDLMNAILGL